ncbi:hypothetical protein ACFYY2_05730 [Streptomyces sp. NPDC001822]|uniref:hypothetical protein n=1 Tax=Streptomyces sp. NPDC001822 TaxID=3364614 RepID=UPI0036B4C108
MDENHDAQTPSDSPELNPASSAEPTPPPQEQSRASSDEVEPSASEPSQTGADEADRSEEDLPSLPDGLPALPRTAAVRKLASTLVTQGFSEGAATAVARAIARPEEARKRLQNPDIMRVPGGILHTITTQVWAPAVCHFPGNNREAGYRVYPLSGALSPGHFPPLRGLEAAPGETGELVLQAQSRAHVVSAMDKSNSFLARHNDLAETIGQHGILRELLLTVVRIDHESVDEPPVWALAGADGSSRISASHRIHALGASDVLYGLPGDDRKYRQLLSQVLGTGERPREEVTPDDVKRARALVAPATLVLRFVPDEGSQLQYDQAVKFIVGITHVEPPKPWGTASENDALADPVIEEFLRAGRLTRTRAEWFAADLTPEEVRSNVLDPWPDTRVAEIVSTFLNTEEHALFRKGVLRITAKSKVTADFKAKVVTEMILRPWRAANADADAADRVSGTRSTLQRMLKWTPLQAAGWHTSGDNDPDKMLEAALRNLKEGGTAEEAGVELGVRGGYYLAVHGTLVREARGRTVDYRTPSSVLQRMTENPHGLRTLHRAIVDGRQNRKPQRVDEVGTPQLNLSNKPLEADDKWLRTTFTAVGESVASPPIEGDVSTPESEFEAAKTHFANLVASLESALVAAESVRGHSRPFVREQGWPQVHAEDLGIRLDKVSGRLKMYAAIAEAAEEAHSGSTDDAEEPDEV